VVDDRSTDGTLQARDAVALHPGMDCTIVTQANQGASGAKNAGIDMATTEYGTLLDGEDLVSDRYVAFVTGRGAALNAAAD